MSKKQTKFATESVPSPCNAARADFEVGRGRPPKHSQFKPGQSGNPKGRPRGSANASKIVERALNRKVSVRKGGKKQTMSTLQAITESQSVKALQGDRHAANFIVSIGTKAGIIRPNQDDPVANDQISMPATQARPSDALLDGVDVHLLSRAEMSDLSQLVELIDSNPDVTALSLLEFERLRHLVGKGRTKNPVTVTGTEGGAL